MKLCYLAMFGRTHSRLIGVIIFLIILWLPTGLASADIGPKPTMDFHFSYPGRLPLSIVSGSLLGCKDDDCQETTSLENHPYTWLHCQPDACTGGRFFSSGPMRLQILFSDNRTRLSNPFDVSAMRNVYSVKVRDADLLVSRNIVLSNNAVWGIYLLIIPFTFAGQLLLAGALLGSNLYIEHRNRNTQLPFKTIPGRYLLAWVLVALVLVAGSLLTWVLPLTVLIESGVAYLYYRFRLGKGKDMERQGDLGDFPKHALENRPPLLPFLTSVATVNLITQPLLWGIATTMTGTMASSVSWPILLMEAGVWLFESILLRVTQWRHLRWGDAFLLSFLMNITSYVIGLLLSLQV